MRTRHPACKSCVYVYISCKQIEQENPGFFGSEATFCAAAPFEIRTYLTTTERLVYYHLASRLFQQGLKPFLLALNSSELTPRPSQLAPMPFSCF